MVAHGLASRDVTVGARADHLVVYLEPALEHDEGVRVAVPVQARAQSGRIADEVVLGFSYRVRTPISRS